MRFFAGQKTEGIESYTNHKKTVYAPKTPGRNTLFQLFGYYPYSSRLTGRGPYRADPAPDRGIVLSIAVEAICCQKSVVL